MTTTQPGPESQASSSSSSLKSRLAAVLPSGKPFHIYHVSTPPTRCDALCSPPPGQRPDRTYCEKHFLAVSIDRPATDYASGPTQKVLVLGVEIFIFTTARATTIFVAKADSTGYLHLLNLPAGTPSPIRLICATFVGFLVEHRRRRDVQFVISLFARAQSQYLFPGSADNKGKHVLDDRGLVKWWCRVLDPLLGDTVGGYLVIPGLDAYETRAFTPCGRSSKRSWTTDRHPLEKISPYTREFDWVPPRCLIPAYPDDPKSRFSRELDEEASNTRSFRTTGSWRSVGNLATFWEMMAFRQECSSGRLTGFIWVVYDDKEPKPESGQHNQPPQTPKKQQKQLTDITPSTTPRKLFPTERDKIGTEDEKKATAEKGKKNKKKKGQTKKLSGIVVARQPRIKIAQRNYLLDRPARTAYYSWGPAGRGDRIVSDTDYKRMSELLLHLDFSSIDKAAGSTRRWVSEVALGSPWGYAVMGEADYPPLQQPAPPTAATTAATIQRGPQQVNNLTGLVKRKRSESNAPTVSTEPKVLAAGLVRKKPKADDKST
ncbi:regulator of Ty1 transposition protein 109 [Geosmithia morbida]|uniref:histone acetyltransferase n=1 Tax=Geosmithia morbida TaxID=1094350 RepID=A0A9P4YRA9_9HYPO|nr:regulator of Ty1 transposition protein 109 [Geosmithia morbida]KAF4120640.1 regulator of Ty1 transposition protein 109 [Geosmithia morbida]